MRNEFRKLSVDTVVDRFMTRPVHDMLATQLGVYLDRSEADEMDLAALVHNLPQHHQAPPINRDDPDSIYAVLCESVKNTKSSLPFLQTLQFLLLIPNEPTRRYLSRR